MIAKSPPPVKRVPALSFEANCGYHFPAGRRIIKITDETGGEARRVMKKKTIRFLWVSLLALALRCVAVFAWLTRVMVAKSDEEKELQEVNNKLGALRHAIRMAENM